MVSNSIKAKTELIYEFITRNPIRNVCFKFQVSSSLCHGIEAGDPIASEIDSLYLTTPKHSGGADKLAVQVQTPKHSGGADNPAVQVQ